MSVSSGPGDERLEILAVEDSPTQAELLRYLLEQSGYRVAVASTGAQALSLLGERAPSAIISDVIMPEMNGYELCRRIRADERTRDIPVILLTSLASSEDVLE
ncbi:MAG: response regulator [candidate division WOR-3 bacterium]|nr:response regulator [candidate division WOR-3 bacterium]